MTNTRLQQDLFRTFGMTREAQACLNCRHFYLHYIAGGQPGLEYATPIHYGHCTYPRCKTRHVDDVCVNFENKYECPVSNLDTGRE